MSQELDLVQATLQDGLCVPQMYQNLPTVVANSFTIPISKKFTIKLHPKGYMYFDYTVTNMDTLNNNFIDVTGIDSMFSLIETKYGTIDIYFGLGIYGKKLPFGNISAGTVLAMKNRTDFDLDYDVEIRKKKAINKFVTTPNKGIDAGVIAIEKWEGMIHYIRLSNFRIKDKSKKNRTR